MVQNKTIWVMIIIALVLLAVSLFISIYSSSINAEPNTSPQNTMGDDQGSLSLVINPQAPNTST